ncbi:Hydroxymethylpyrimidine ABC transporter, ATPase component [Caldisalinibacter kiritimatiensis]|uniref:Hydroxymethylpyrimidine ABC transporter, ATPase component n=2 Tax=Caldisalinibacter kiritimatiensis TaxID=1304284 RepID=R1CPT0_9FIRM|nr:Hydroxymethylpyrimidine ABC transporter, ATPase component [Caldisalinibacter kiritimatiensis]
MLVVNNVSITLQENEFVSVIGPSGCGKSTIFNMIAGLIKPDSGDVFIDDEKYTGITGRVSYMYQKDLLLPWKKIIDNVSIPLIIKGHSKNEARKKVKDYFEVFGLSGFEYKYPFQLSGGMRQRAALMRTYMFSKDVILLDEPFGGLDAITKTKMQYWLLEVLEKLKASILFITHDIEEAIFLSDRIYILSDRPATIKKEIRIDLPKPRTQEILTSKEFNDLKRHVLNIL